MNIQDVPNKASFMEDKNLNDHLLITIFCYLDITTLLKSVNVTCKEFNVLQDPNIIDQAAAVKHKSQITLAINEKYV